LEVKVEVKVKVEFKDEVKDKSPGKMEKSIKNLKNGKKSNIFGQIIGNGL
jgi:hypothetical protein